MNGSFLSIFVEIFVAILLLATIIYCFIVNRKLDNLRSNQKNLKAIIRDLNQSTIHAESAIGELRVTVDRAGQDLGERIDHAEHLSTKLGKQNEATESLLSKLITVSRATEKKAKSGQIGNGQITQNDVTAAFQRSSQDFARSMQRSNTTMQQDYSLQNTPQTQHIQNINPAMPQSQMNNRQNVQNPAQHATQQNGKTKLFPRLRLRALAQQGLPETN